MQNDFRPPVNVMGESIFGVPTVKDYAEFLAIVQQSHNRFDPASGRHKPMRSRVG